LKESNLVTGFVTLSLSSFLLINDFKIQVSRDVTPRVMGNIYRRFEGPTAFIFSVNRTKETVRR
jgi:hypothetical protein